MVTSERVARRPGGARRRIPGVTGVRPEIQALRAVAVMAVVLFHIWKDQWPGGYVGVDIFFVISGFLITSHLAREVGKHGTVRLGAFWARRVRRLLPAALLVLLVTALGVLLWSPQGLWDQHLGEIIASALYVENWRLAADAVDYLAAENDASPVQHYWSLSVEEQFYLVWPLVIVGVVALTRGRSAQARHRGFVAAMAVILATSLAYSVYLTETNPGAAYFVTPTRAWEFAAGGLLALLAPRPSERLDALRSLAQWLGWAAIFVTIFTYTGATPFPGYQALLPVVGTLLVIWSGAPRAVWSPMALVNLRPVQYTGDVSYSVYLWHWPLVVLVPFAVERDVDGAVAWLVLAASVGLGALTKKVVEDPARTRGRWIKAPARRSFGYMAVGMVVVSLVCAAGLWRADVVQDRSAVEARELLREGGDCVGASAFLGPDAAACPPLGTGKPLVPARAAVLKDTGGAYACYDQEPGADLGDCTFGPQDAATRVALVGDSHGASLVPGLKEQVDELDWRLDVFVGRGCVWARPTADDCEPRRTAIHERLMSGDYDMVVVTARRSKDAGPVDEERVEAYASVWREVAATGTKVVAVADNPLVPEELTSCVIDAASDAEAAECGFSEAEGFATGDPLPAAAKAAGDGVHLVDLSAAYCADGVCPMVIGNVVTYRDQHHITATFSRTLAPYLVAELEDVLAAS